MSAPKGLFLVFLLVDVSFIVYWAITYLHLLPPEFLYKDYTNPVLVDWNWSFFPIDMLISISGLHSIRLYRKHSDQWVLFAFVSLILTMCSGLMAISFWIFHNDFDLAWWLPNIFLLLYPLYYLGKVYKGVAIDVPPNP
jgi:hypothetical protein